MNIETVRSLTSVLKSVKDILVSGPNADKTKKLKHSLLDIQNTEQDLRDHDFVEASRNLYESLDKIVAKPADKPPEKPAPAAEVKKPEPLHAQTPAKVETDPPAKFPPAKAADLSVSKGGLTGK